MCDRIGFACKSRPGQLILLMVCLSAVLGASTPAQKNQPPGPKYDVQTESKIKGTVEDVKLPPKGSEKEIAHLVVKDGANSVDVYLCPKSFFDDMGMSFAKGDEVALTGSKVKEGDADLFLVREIVKGTDTFALRDAKGEPVWDWRH